MERELFSIPLNLQSEWPLDSPVGTKMAEGGRVAAVFGPVKLAMNESVFPGGISQKSEV